MMTGLIRSVVVTWFALAVCGSTTVAQQTERPERLLQRAIATLDSAETERGVDLLRVLLSSVPSSEALGARVEAHMFLGAASWALELEDSAVVHLREVVRLDPFYTVDPDRFNPGVRELHQSLRSTTVVVRLRAPADTALSPFSERLPVSVGVGTPGQVNVRLRNMEARSGALIATLQVDSSADVEVPLTSTDGSALEPGTYELEAEVTTADGRECDLVSLTIERLPVDTMPHEPPIPESDFLREEERGSPSLLDIGRGVGFGLAATAVPTLLGNRDLRDAAVPSQAIVLGVAIALADIVASRPMRPIHDNVEYNRRLLNDWRAVNLDIADNNETLRRLAPMRIRVGGAR